MRKPRRLFLGIGVVAVVAGFGTYAFVLHLRIKSSETHRTFEVHYVWDSGVKSLRIVNTEKGGEESDPNLRAKVAAVAESQLPRIVGSAGLTRAVGRFYADTWGQDVLYLPRFGTATDPDLARDPAVTPLMSALDRYDGVKARQLIAAGANVNASDQHGWTALMTAAMNGDVATVQALLAAGAEVNARNKDGETALSPAAFLGRTAAVRELALHGADVNAASKQGITPLMEAAQHSLPVIKFLIANGAEVNATDALGETALIMAARAGNEDIVKTLIKARANVNAKDAEGRTALSSAHQLGYTGISQLLKRAGGHD